MEIRRYANREKETLWDETKRLVHPQKMPVDLSQKLYDLKQQLISVQR
jgi:nicotinate phosphoribosyltransferase